MQNSVKKEKYLEQKCQTGLDSKSRQLLAILRAFSLNRPQKGWKPHPNAQLQTHPQLQPHPCFPVI